MTRHLLVRTLQVSVAGLAVLAIYADLFSTFGSFELRLMLAEHLALAYSLVCLACLTVVNGPNRAVGQLGIGLASGTAVLGQTLIWLPLTDDGDAIVPLLRAFIVGGVLSVALGHTSLLLRVARRRSPVTDALLVATVACLGTVALLLCSLALGLGAGDGAGFWHLLSVASILDVSGTVLLPLQVWTARPAQPPARMSSASTME